MFKQDAVGGMDTDAQYKIPGSSVNNSYNEHLTYDRNGNILSLKRNGEKETEQLVFMIDNLDYKYDGNRLINVTDSTDVSSGFNDGNKHVFTELNDFEYDDYGNMVKDRNKKITEIIYNHLNLPKKITFENMGTIEYIYGADGVKLKKTVTEGSTNKTVDYLDGYQYRSNLLSFFPTAEGYVRSVAIGIGGTPNYSFHYVYNYTDHLGNIRLKYTKHPQTGVLEILEENQYYPFGLKHENYNSEHQIIDIGEPTGKITLIPVTPNLGDSYQYRFGGMEQQTELGLEFYDFGARNYDAAIGRWMNVDPLSDHPDQVDKSSYSAFWNNPIKYTDPDGRCPDCPDEVYVPLADHVYNAKVGDKTSNGWEVMRVDNQDNGYGDDYQGALYKGTYNGNTEYIYATAGTDFTSAEDWKNNAQQIISGNSPQYATAVEIAKTEAEASPGVSFTGHSLGGGLASANALATEGKAVTFNAAGLSKPTKDNLRLTGNKADISAYVVNGEVVSYYQGAIGLKAEGKITTLPARYVPNVPGKADNTVRMGQRIYNHTMGVVTKKFNKYNKKK